MMELIIVPFLVLFFFLTTKIKAKIEFPSLQVFRTSWNAFEEDISGSDTCHYFLVSLHHF